MRLAASGTTWSAPFNFNPRTPCGVRPLGHQFELVEATISIHAPHAGCDSCSRSRECRYTYISIHAPHAGCDRSATSSSWLRQRFQSTHPMRGATWPSAGISACSKNFNPRTPCGVRPIVKFHALLALGISIHAPHAGCDLVVFSVYICTGNFNPRTPCGVRLIVKQIISAPLKIFQSTHPMRGATLTGGHCF